MVNSVLEFLRFSRVIALVLVLTAALAVYAGLFNPALAAENAPLEWLQVTILLLAGLVQALRSLAALTRSERTVRTGLAMLMLCFALRELDINEFGTSAAVVALEQQVQWVKFALGFWLLGFLVISFRHIYVGGRTLFASPMMLFSLLGGALLLLSAIFDGNGVGISAGLAQVVEETLELQAYFFLLMAAITPAKAAHLALPPVAGADPDRKAAMASPSPSHADPSCQWPDEGRAK